MEVFLDFRSQKGPKSDLIYLKRESSHPHEPFFFHNGKNRHHNAERHHRSAHTLHLTVVWANRTTSGWLRVKFVCSAASRTKLIARSSPDFGVGNDESIGYYRADLRTRSLIVENTRMNPGGRFAPQARQ